MSNKKFKYVSSKKIKQILDDNTDYLILLGERSNGKSYSCKSLAFQECYDNDRKLIVLKRFDLECKDSMIVNYFNDIPIQEITKGKYTHVDVYRKEIYLSTLSEKTNKVIHGPKIGYVQSLSSDSHYKSLSFPDVDYILFEEFVATDNQYLYNECNRLQNHVSTIFRQRKGKVLLIGNTISRICPYYNEWELSHIKDQKQGSVDKYIMKNENGEDTVISVYLTDSLNFNSGMFFGNVGRAITNGAYEVKTYPHLEESVRHFKMLYQFVLEYNEFKFLCQLLQHNENSDNITWFISPKTSEIKNNTRVFSNKFSLDPMYSMTFKDCYESEKRLIMMLLNKRVCYSDNLTGTEFNALLKNFL